MTRAPLPCSNGSGTKELPGANSRIELALSPVSDNRCKHESYKKKRTKMLGSILDSRVQLQGIVLYHSTIE